MTGPDHRATATVIGERHRLTERQLDALAAGRHDPAALDTLRRSEHSRRLLLLRAILDYARKNPGCTGPLPPIDDAWQLLVDAQRRDADVVADVLDYPQVGMWAAHTLRRFRGVATDSAPLWGHVGYLHALAAAAAIRVGLSFTMAIPCHAGDAVLPTLGSARLSSSGEWTVAAVRSVGGQAEVVGSTGWRSIPELRGEVRLDDIDPYRGLAHPMPPAPLPDHDIHQWQELAAEAWDLLTRHHPEQAAELDAGVLAVVPLAATSRLRVHSASAENGFGGALMSRPPDAAALAVTLVHEFQHSKLAAVQHLAPLLTGVFPAVHHAPWRDDPRPPAGLFQGVYAFTAVTEFWAVHRERDPLAQFEFAHWRGQTLASLRTLRAQPALTELGRRFLDVVATRLHRLLPLTVPDDVGRLAEAAAVDHLASWQVSHLRPSVEFVDRAVDAWRHGRPVPNDYAAEIVPAAAVQRLDVKALLSRLHITDPATFAALRKDPEQISDAAAGDFAYVAGDPAAKELYLAELADSPNRAGAWSGLGLACAATGSPAAEALLRRPELVRAIYLRVKDDTRRAAGIEELAAWLR